MSQEKEQSNLIEEIGIGIEESLHLSPLASRIYALLILSSLEGLTFDAVKEIVKASKSSVSVNIKVLTQLGHVFYTTKTGDRKRYFKIAKYSSIISLDLYLNEIDKERLMLQKINAFNKKYHPEKFVNEKSLGEIFEEYLQKKEKLVKETIQKMENFKNADK